MRVIEFGVSRSAGLVNICSMKVNYFLSRQFLVIFEPTIFGFVALESKMWKKDWNVSQIHPQKANTCFGISNICHFNITNNNKEFMQPISISLPVSRLHYFANLYYEKRQKRRCAYTANASSQLINNKNFGRFSQKRINSTNINVNVVLFQFKIRWDFVIVEIQLGKSSSR